MVQALLWVYSAAAVGWVDQTCITILNIQDELQNWVTPQLLLAFEIRSNRHVFSVHVQQLCRRKAIEGFTEIIL